jgi:hypothetical protein
MTVRPLLITAARVCVAVGVVGAVAMFASPVGAHHSVDFDSYNCSTETPAPDEEPDITPQPTDPPGDQPPPPAEPTPAPQNCMPMSGERVWGTRVLRFSTSSDGARPLRRVALYVLSEEDAIPSANNGEPLLEETYSRGDDVRIYSEPFSWNSLEATPHNGTYKVKVEVDTWPAFAGNDVHRATAERKGLLVDNPPKSVGAPKILAKTVGSVTLQWDPATEPDVISYTVYRAVTKTTTKPPYSALKPAGITTGNAFRDDKVSPGYYWYSVKVTRRSVVTPDEGISSALSPMSAAAQVKSLAELTKDDDKKVKRKILDLRPLPTPPGTSRLAGLPDAPFSYKLPVGDAPASEGGGNVVEGSSEEGGTDPRGPVLPVAVGMFLVSSALAVGRMPY